MGLKITVFAGDITAAAAEAICTSTNARLTLMMGTGGAVRDRGGFEVLRECEALLAAAGRDRFPPGSVHVTSAGKLPYRAVIHCVASDPTSHLSSDGIVRACVTNALARADELGIRTLAMPVFATGHARFKFERALAVMHVALNSAKTNVEQIFIAVSDEDRVAAARLAF